MSKRTFPICPPNRDRIQHVCAEIRRERRQLRLEIVPVLPGEARVGATADGRLPVTVLAGRHPPRRDSVFLDLLSDEKARCHFVQRAQEAFTPRRHSEKIAG